MSNRYEMFSGVFMQNNSRQLSLNDGQVGKDGLEGYFVGSWTDLSLSL